MTADRRSRRAREQRVELSLVAALRRSVAAAAAVDVLRDEVVAVRETDRYRDLG
jgi:hypothetical protein